MIIKLTKEEMEHQLHCLELDEQGFDALRAMCYQKHSKYKGVGVAAMCVCGYCTQSGSVECRALRIAYDLWRHRKEESIRAIQDAYQAHLESEAVNAKE